MSNFTDFGETLMCNIIRGQNPSFPAQFRVALLTEVSDASYVEVSWTGYARQNIDRSLNAWCGTQGAGSVTASNGNTHTTSNNVRIDFGDAGTAVTIAAVGLFIGEDMLGYSVMNAPLTVEAGDPVSISPGALVFTVGITGGMTDYLSNKLIDWIWRGQTWSFPTTMYLALNTGVPTNSTRGTEVNGVAYTRKSQLSSSWSTPNNGTISNSEALVFSVPASNWGNIVAFSFYDASTNGNMLFWATVSSAKTIVNGGAAPRFDEGAIVIQAL